MRLATVSVLSSTLCLLACRAVEPDRPPPVDAAGSQPSGAPPAAGAPPTVNGMPQPSSDPEVTNKLADLDDMCKALNRDYGDGTLGDYYAGLELRTNWGKQQIAAGNESMQPGRLLERAVVELAPGSDALAHCRKLLEYLDEVE